jgi:hypothetical protein
VAGGNDQGGWKKWWAAWCMAVDEFSNFKPVPMPQRLFPGYFKK